MLLHCDDNIGVSFRRNGYLNPCCKETVSAKELISWMFLVSELHLILSLHRAVCGLCHDSGSHPPLTNSRDQYMTTQCSLHCFTCFVKKKEKVKIALCEDCVHALVCLPVCVSTCWPVPWSVCQSICSSAHEFTSASSPVRPSVGPSVPPSFCQSVNLPIYPSICDLHPQVTHLVFIKFDIQAF
jgi:hypothetical protein